LTLRHIVPRGSTMTDHLPVEPAVLLAYALAALALAIAPGPGQALVLTRTVEADTGGGLLTSLGLEIGTLVHTLAAAFGLSAILATSATAYAVMKYAGALYLVVLGALMLWRARASGHIGAVAGHAAAARDSRLVLHAAMTGVLNPKVAVFFLAFLRNSCGLSVAPFSRSSWYWGWCCPRLGSSSMRGLR
jgi:threonine/homoserine/homoserine lactone efflux protein